MPHNTQRRRNGEETNNTSRMTGAEQGTPGDASRGATNNPNLNNSGRNAPRDNTTGETAMGGTNGNENRQDNTKHSALIKKCRKNISLIEKTTAKMKICCEQCETRCENHSDVQCALFNSNEVINKPGKGQAILINIVWVLSGFGEGFVLSTLFKSEIGYLVGFIIMFFYTRTRLIARVKRWLIRVVPANKRGFFLFEEEIESDHFTMNGIQNILGGMLFLIAMVCISVSIYVLMSVFDSNNIAEIQKLNPGYWKIELIARLIVVVFGVLAALYLRAVIIEVMKMTDYEKVMSILSLMFSVIAVIIALGSFLVGLYSVVQSSV